MLNRTPPAGAYAAAPSELLEIAVRLAGPDTRAEAADRLAKALGAEALIVFIRDPEVNALLPAPGFPQTIPDGKAWRDFLARCAASGGASGELRYLRSDDRARPVAACAAGEDAVIALVGLHEPVGDVGWLRTLLPLLAAVFRGERAAEQARMQARLASETASRAAMLAAALDRSRHQLEVALEESRAARAAADTANRAKSDFLATMSHELRTPLNAIGGHVELLTMEIHGPIAEAQRVALDRIGRNARHLLGLINDILNLSRIEAGRVDYLLCDLPLEQALEDIAPMIEPQLTAKSLVYEIRGAGQLPVVRADREKLEQILLNLLSNAVKFTASGGRVWIETALTGDDRQLVALRVGDTGIGIPEDKWESIFEPFTQVDASRSRAEQGTGLGLSISRQLARGMGGDLVVDSQPGAGSVFTVLLDAVPPAPRAR